MKRFTPDQTQDKLSKSKDLSLPVLSDDWQSILGNGQSFQVDGTNVVRVPFGIRRPLKQRPERSDNWATLVLPFNPLGNPTPPPQAA
tara:strand:- start:1337 stop:1597 length:261 start_codon:yes stop_codon:yes gene_type:complete